MRPVSTGALGAILSVARGVRSGCANPRLGALDAGGALTRGADGASNERLGALTAGGLLRKVGACGLLSKRGLGDGWNDRDGPGDGADGRELNDGLRLIEPTFGPPPPRLPNDGDGAIDRLGADALGADRLIWLEPPPPPPPLLRPPPILPCP
jgi:hypothetical protein